jgi:hypothetical protein
MTPAAERTFIIPVSNGIFAHRERIGAAIWVFLWLIDHTTKEVQAAGGKVDGLVYGGRPVLLGEMTSELALCMNSVREHLAQLAEGGYIRKIDHGNGRANGYAVVNSKRFNRRKGPETIPEKQQGTPETPPEKRHGTLPEKQQDPTRKAAGTLPEKQHHIKETNHYKPRHSKVHATETVAETFTLTAEQSNPEKKKPEQSDPRHRPVLQAIIEGYRKKNLDAQGRPMDPPDIPKCAGVLRDFLGKCNWSTEELRKCVSNRFESEHRPVSQAPADWIKRLTDFKTPLDGFGRPKVRVRKLRTTDEFGNPESEEWTNDKPNGHNRAQDNLDSALRSRQAARELLGIDSVGVDEAGGDARRAPGREGPALGADGRPALRLERGSRNLLN